MLERRCLFLFLALVALLIALPFLSEIAHGPIILTLVNITVLLTAVAAVGRTRFSFIIAVFLVVPALVFRLLALESAEPGYLALSWHFTVALSADSTPYPVPYGF